MDSTRKLTGVMLGMVFLLASFPCRGDAEIPKKINYQGYLTTSAGVPVNGTVPMVFSIYDSASAVTPLWTETNTAVSVTHGVYSVNLGDIVAINLLFNVPYYLGVKVGSDPEMTPRRILTSVGYAYRALYVDTVGGHTHAASEITSGTLDPARFSAYSDLAAEGYLDNTSDSDLLTRAQSDARYVNESQAGSVTAAMVSPSGSTNGQVLTSTGSAVSWQTPSQGGSGWVDDGTVVRLTTSTDRVGIGTSSPGANNRLEVNGYAVVGSDAKGIRMRSDGILVDLESLGSALAINWQGGDTYMNTYGGNVGIGALLPTQKLHVGGNARFDGNVGIGTDNPQQKLHVAGVARFDLGTGQIHMSTPGGWPGIIMYSPNGHRRDLIVDDFGLRILTGTSSSPPPADNGIAVLENGRLVTRVLEITGGSDLSEQFEIRKSSRQIPLEPGMVVVIDPERPGRLMVSSRAYDRRVAGILSGAGGLKPGMLMGQRGSEADGAHPVALTGRVYCLADASHGPIEPGDLMTSSETPGHAMKATDPARAQGAVIGKAMTRLSEGKGLVLVLVSLQ